MAQPIARMTCAAAFLLSAIPVVQQLRESAFFRNGQQKFREKAISQFPTTFAGQSVAMSDTLPRPADWSGEQRVGGVAIMINGVPVLSEAPAMIRVGFEIGRYHRWIAASRVTRVDGTDSALIVARQRIVGDEPVIDVLTIDANGKHSVRSVSRSQRAESFPLYRVVSQLGEETPPVFPAEHWSWLPGFMLQVIAPWVVCAVSGMYLLVQIVMAVKARA